MLSNRIALLHRSDDAGAWSATFHDYGPERGSFSCEELHRLQTLFPKALNGSIKLNLPTINMNNTIHQR